MDVKQAVAKAKEFLGAVFADEEIAGLRLEEVEYDRQERAWLVTLGMTRPSVASEQGALTALMNQGRLRQAYKVVRIPEDTNDYPSIKIREFGNE
ncbi:hypothetical protein [Methylobacterium oryzihabitans]|uniref:Uncharacterized protein n=1 Tax=Methylobacterium oryzihabitans TaxID=2499852 RepID=A0A3S2VBI9_9HYPH|nr:hypothetical protein [Methylobacterium oryzihabitans]RVU20544.1 hypothetical protein EOE48_04120 [Methylobacterium oryzihabitans]